jgi:fatty acid desaturase/cytochrome b involved in lipid metabolism
MSTLHHFCCLVCYGLGLDDALYPVLMRPGHMFLLAEASTACMNLRFFAVRANRLAEARLCERLFVICFFVTRIAVGIPLSANWWAYDLPRIPAPAVQLIYMLANVAWNVMNVWAIYSWHQRRSIPAGAYSANRMWRDTSNKQERLLSIECVDNDIDCHLTVSSALDCHMDLWFFPTPKPVTSAAAPEELDRKFVTKIHGKWYDLSTFKHPGGPVALSLVGGRDGSALFESHHPFTSQARLQAVLCKYLVPGQEHERQASVLMGMTADDGGHYVWGDSDAFEQEIKHEISSYFKGEAARRGVSVLAATKATPRRWLEILALFVVFACTVPALVGGKWWALFLSPLACWIWMVNYWHDSTHFALSTSWRVNAVLPYLCPWFSSPTTWYHQHVIGHHAYPNVGHRDPDLAHSPQLLREHSSIRWRNTHRTQHHLWRVALVWSIAVGLGLHLVADAKLFLQKQYNRVVPGQPSLRGTTTLLSHAMGRIFYLATTIIWPWFIFDNALKAALFAVVPIVIFSLLFMVNSQINHLTPDTAHASSTNFWRHQVVTAQDFGADGSKWHRVFCFIMSGGLNYQVEHHLFPTVCHCHHAALHPIVVRVCEKHKIAFHRRKGYFDAIRHHLAHNLDMASPPKED